MSYLEKCVPCGRTYQLDPAGLQVNRWRDANPGDEWQVLGWCPVCGELILSHTCRHPKSALELVDAGAALVELPRDRELDDRQRRRGWARRLSGDEIELIVAIGADLLDDGPRFDRAVEMLVDRYGSGR